MKHLGDITKINGFDVSPVNVIIGGSPCQDLSIAGKRAGLAGERSGLFMEQLRVIKEMREADANRGRKGKDIRPRFMVWENVPGAFSSNNGADFGAVLQETVRVVCKEAPVVPMPKNGWPKAGCLFGVDGSGGDGVSLGVYSMLSFGEFPSGEAESHLSQILEDAAPQKYYLSAKACQGILNRANRRGKKLPKLLELALLSMIEYWQTGGGQVPYTLKMRGGKPGGGKGPLIQTDKSATLSTLQDQTLFQPILMTMQAIGQYKECGVSSSCKMRDYKDATDLVCEPVLLESNQNHAVITENGICTTLPASMGMGGGYVPMITEPKAVSIEPGIAAREGGHYYEDVSGTLRANAGDNQMAVCQPIPINEMIASRWNKLGERTGLGIGKAGDPAFTISAAHPHAVFCLQGNGIDRANTAGCNGAGWKEGTSYTLNTIDRPAVAFEAVCAGFSPQQGAKANGIGWQEECSPTLRSALCGFPSPAVVYDSKVVFDARGNGEGNISPTITGDHENRVTDYTAVCVEKLIRWIVRRLTPLECERLQGFPDGWTDIGDWVDSKGKKHTAADTPRYKALGNSIALPSWFYVLQKLSLFCGSECTMASLFDGIGGFPLIWESLNGKGSCLWASEIEEFPIAVTSLRFAADA